VRTGVSDTAFAELQRKRAFACRLTPDRSLETVDEAEAFLRERGMLTRTPDCSLPSLFEACHEEAYAPARPGFGQWPRTKWSWSFTLLQRPGVYALKVHHRRKTLYVGERVARIIDPIVRGEIERMRSADPRWTHVLDHLAATGPSTGEDLKTELGLKPRELKAILYPLELCGTILNRPIEPADDGTVEGYEYVRWDDVFPKPASSPGGIEELLVAGVRAAVLATEHELPRWFAWHRLVEPELVERLVSDGRLVRPAPGWLAAPTSS
jgi:hypothetical protein